MSVQSKCNMLSFMKMMNTVKDNIKKEHTDLLELTPFWPIISAYKDGKITKEMHTKSDIDIMKIVQRFNATTGSFEFGDTSITLTPKDISIIFGLPEGGMHIKIKDTKGRKRTKFTETYFKGVTRLHKKKVEEEIEKIKTSKDSNKIKDFVRLLAIELCLTLLFTNTGYSIAWCLVECCENLEDMGKYAWADAVQETLMNSLTHTDKTKPLNGCVVALLVMKTLFM